MNGLTAGVVAVTLFLHVGVASAAQDNQPRGEETIAGEFVRRLPIGTNVKLRLDDRTTVKGLLMGIEEGTALIKVRTRIPEEPRKVSLSRIADADIVQGGGLAKGVAIGVAIGVGSTFLFGMLMAAVLGD
jgi:hypothetical protein